MISESSVSAAAAEEGPAVEVQQPYDDLADFLGVFADRTRLRILRALMDKEMCVHKLAAHLRMQQPAVSHQLRVLRQARLVRARRVAKEAHYSLADDHVRAIFELGLAHITEG